MKAGGAVAATRIDCPCGHSFLKDGNNPIMCPKDKRIQTLESAMLGFVYDSNLAISNSLFMKEFIIRKSGEFQQLLTKKQGC